MHLPAGIIKGLLYSHIAGGTVALITGGIAIASAKGGRLHKKAGLVFFWAMVLVAVSALVIALVKGNNFLLAVGIFSFYLTYTGYRVLKSKSGKYVWNDWVVTTVSLACAAYMLSTLNIVLVTFGCLLTVVIYRNTIAQFKGEDALKEVRKKRIPTHLGNMSGSYIATVTAFAVVNINFIQPGWLVWLFPSAIGVPFIVYQLRRRAAAKKA